MNWTSRAVYSTTTIFVACFIEGEKQKEKQSTNLSIKKKTNHLQRLCSIWSLIFRIKDYDPCTVTQSRHKTTQLISTQQDNKIQIQYSTVQFSTAQYSTVQYRQYSTMHTGRSNEMHRITIVQYNKLNKFNLYDPV